MHDLYETPCMCSNPFTNLSPVLCTRVSDYTTVMTAEDVKVNTEEASRKKRSTAKTVSVQEPEYSIQDVLPSTQYLIAIAARTKIGTGAFTNITIQTGRMDL